MDNERIWTLIAKKLAGEATAEDILELYDLLQEHPEVHYSLEIFDELWQQNQFAKDRPVAAYARLLKKMEQQGIQFPAGSRLPLQQRIYATHTSLKTSAAKPFWSTLIATGQQITNNFKVTCRNLLRNKAHSLINITGLAIGMAAAILILLWIFDELSFDKFQKNRDRIYHVMTRATVNGHLEAWGGTSSLLAPVMKNNYSEVEEVTRMNQVSAFMFHTGDKHLGGFGIITDPAFLKIFDYPLLQGNILTALNDPRGIVVTESFAKKLFGTVNAMGKTVRIDSNALFTVTGILEDIPTNSHLRFEYLIPFSYNKEVNWDRPSWESTIIGTVVMLKPGVSEKKANASFVNIVKSHNKSLGQEIFLHPMHKWHLYSQFENGHAVAGRLKTVRLFGIISGLILLIACINYMNLSTARSVNRAKEVGIRKVVLIAFLIASPLAWWTMNGWLQDYSYRVNISWWIFALAGLVSVIIALATVGYQSIKAALANPVRALRNE